MGGGQPSPTPGSKQCKCCGQSYFGNDDVCGAKTCRESGFSKFATCEIPVGKRFHGIIYGNRVYSPQEFANEFRCEVKIDIDVFYPQNDHHGRG